MTNTEKAKEIVKSILKDLEDRRGFKHLLEDRETYNEIKSDLVKIVDNKLTHWEN